jgi:hypothetical protein
MVLTLCLLPSFLFPQASFGQVRKPTGQMVYQKVTNIAEKKAEAVFRALPAGNVLMVQTEQNQAVRDEIAEQIKNISTATNQEIAEFKKSLIKINEQELSEMSREMRGYLAAMRESELQALADIILKNPAYEDQKLEYQSAFTVNEKRRAIQNALQEDLGFLRSVYNKKIGRASREELKKDLENNLKVFNNQQSTKADNKKLLQISLIALAGVALLTWGISSAVYGARLDRVRSEREAKLAELKKNLMTQYQAYYDQLTQQELDYLKQNGYFRVVCGTYSQPDSILCNRYDYRLFNGNKHCTVYCWKNAQNGKETLHEPAVCTSPFIPSDCYDPQEYWDAYARGKDDGYDDGYDEGYDDGDSDGYYDGREDGRDDGYSHGYDDGYDHGYDDGYSAGASDATKSRSFFPFRKSEEYLRGYRDGLEQYQIIFLNY